MGPFKDMTSTPLLPASATRIACLNYFGQTAAQRAHSLRGSAQILSNLLNSAVKAAVRLFGLLMVFAMVQAHAETQNKITALSVTDSGAGVTVVKVELAQPLANPPAGFTINTPPRIALDFPDTANALGKSVQDFAVGGLRSANIVQAGTRTRLVINLNQMLSYDTRLEGNNVLITLQGKVAEVAATTSRFAEARQGTQKHTLSDLDFHRGKNGEARIQVDLSDSGVGIDIHRQGTKLVVDFLKTNLPGKLQRKLDVVDFATPVQTVNTFAQGDNIRMEIEPKGNWEHAAYQTDNKFIIEVKQVVEDPNKLVKGGQAGYAGEKLTLNFQDISVREALNVIADFTELNMVISDSVSGNLTLRLKDVPWDQALDIILQSRDLEQRKNGNVIRVAPREELAKSEKTGLTSRQEISELEELHTESFQLGYQTASAVADILMGKGSAGQAASASASPAPTPGNAATARILSNRGSAMADARTNTLFVKDTSSRLEEVRKIIRQVDVPARQVLIEARVVEARDGFARNLGVRLGVRAPSSLVTPGTGNVNLPTLGGTGTSNFTLFGVAATKVLNVELTAMESDSQGKIISSPRVVSADKDTEWAIIEQGEEIPYAVDSVVGGVLTRTISFKKAVLRLGVKTKITPDNNIDMTVEVNKDSRGDLIANAGVAINTNKVLTKVLVENGGTVVIGGVYKQNDQTVVNKVPLLGDIPVLGNLFKSKATSVTKDELLVFLSPKIMQDALNLR